MLRRILGAGVFGMLALGAQGVSAQESAVDPDTFELGKELYGGYCVQCHRSTGEGVPPTFPALVENENLADAELIIINITQGKGAMPAFANLDDDQVAAVATYIRNEWGNEFAPVGSDAVAALRADDGDGPELASVWSGVYTDAQAERGETVYNGACAMCHGRRLNGAPEDPDMRSTPPLARDRLIRRWENQSVASLYEYTKSTMPVVNPGYLEDQVYADILAYMFQVTGMPEGDEELPGDTAALNNIIVEYEPE